MDDMDVVEINSYEDACRLCLDTEQTRSSIFGVPDESIPFTEKIQFCLSIKVTSNDKLSTLVCETCIKNINNWHSYKNVCLRSQEKLQQWLSAKLNTSIQPTATIKEEPVDVEFKELNQQTEINDNDINEIASTENGTDVIIENSIVPSPIKEMMVPEESLKTIEKADKGFPTIFDIKTEPLDTEDEDDCNIDVESINSGELLINPMAIAAVNTVGNKDRIMEADSTQKFSTKRFMSRKKGRRGPHTHYRGIRLFKKKCIHCKIYLHSKYSYTQHMSRYHGIVNSLAPSDHTKIVSQPTGNKQKSKLSEHVDTSEQLVDTQNDEISPEEAEYEKMIKTDPLTSVQKNLISQLKTFSCYTCNENFFDRRHTLNHIRQHMPDLQPYTCIACLTEFSDRSMYKLHCGASFECAMKIALVVPKIGNEKYFTCNMCLRPFDNRKELLTHLAMHADKQYKQLSQPMRSPPKLKPIAQISSPSRIDLSPHKKSAVNLSGPYVNGDPAHNHMCDLCGMIYKHKINMFKHRELCSTLPESIRTSYRCIHCSVTYLVYKKFYTHIFKDHKKREITCFTCYARFESADDYLTHHETHRITTNNENTNETINIQQPENEFLSDSIDSSNPKDVNEKPYNCALCRESFATKLELSEHRNLHLKVKIYSCVICRSMFSSSGALETHMKDHGIEDSEQNANNSCLEYGRGRRSQNSHNESSLSATSDPGGQFNHCYPCNKNFSNLANLKRHERNLHYQQKRWSCTICKRRFKSAEDHEEHYNLEHGPQAKFAVDPLTPSLVSPLTGKPIMQCPKCPKTFTYQGNLIMHCQNVHKENHFERARATATRQPSVTPRIAPHSYACNICGKTFKQELSLKTHRGWHIRSNYKLKSEKNLNVNKSLDETVMSGPGYTMTMTSSPKPAKARKSFPNNPPQKQLNAISSLQCQVCDDRFPDVAELRKHLWDVHCARNKPEKIFTSDLQCELCTNKFPDEDALENHMKWHSQNPILSNTNSVSAPRIRKKMFNCDICGKDYSNRKLFLRHKKLHKVLPVATMMNLQSLQTKRPYCQACQKSFCTDASLKRHKTSPSHQAHARAYIQQPGKKITTTAIVHHPPTESVKLTSIKKEPGVDYPPINSQSTSGVKKKPVTCLVCQMIFPSMSILYRHKQLVHNFSRAKVPAKMKISSKQTNECVPLVSNEGMICCNVCGRQFPGISNLKQHFAHKHRNKGIDFPCTLPGCKMVFPTTTLLKNHLSAHASIVYNCHLCDRHVFSRASMNKHMMTMHKAIYQSGANKSTLWSETDLATYTVKNSVGTECPKCKIKYPNLRALKIHYLKFHEKT